MSTAPFTMDDIVAAADAKFGSTNFEIDGRRITLLNPIRMSSEKRQTLRALQAEINDVQHRADEDHSSYDPTVDIEVEQVRLLKASIRAVAEDSHQATVLLSALGDDLGLLMSVFDIYNSREKVGEA